MSDERADRRRGVLERSLENLTIGVLESVRQREHNLKDTQTGEWEQQVHVPIAGHAIATWGYVDSPVQFEMPMVGSPSQRMSSFDRPHFTYGVELTNSQSLVVFNVHVVKWTVNEFGWVVGATVRFAVSAPLASTPYAAIAHLSFQGYGGLAEGSEFNA